MSALVVILAAAAVSGAPAVTPVDLIAALFKSEAAELTKHGYVCLQVNGDDPGEEQLNALSRSNPRVVEGSACTKVMDTEKGSVHTATGKPAYFFDVHDFVNDAAETADVKISIYHHGMWAIFKTLEVRKLDGSWVVLRVKAHSEA